MRQTLREYHALRSAREPMPSLREMKNTPRPRDTDGMGPGAWVGAILIAGGLLGVMAGLDALSGYIERRVAEAERTVDQRTLAQIVERAGCAGVSWPTILSDGQGRYRVACVEAVRNCQGCRARLAEAR